MDAVDQKKKSVLKILVVDNDPVLLRAITTMLKQEGCEVMEAETGLDALEILDKTVPDIIFTDLIMPRISGEQLCRVVRSSNKYKDVFIVVLSAIVLEDRKRILEEVECDLCLAKGNLKELREQISFALQAYDRKDKNILSSFPVSRIPTGLKPSEIAGELLREKQHNHEIFSNLREGILEITTEGNIVTANKSACEILDRSEEELTGVRLPDASNWQVFDSAIIKWVAEELTKEGMQSFHIYEDHPLYIDDRVVTASFIPVKEKNSIFGLCIFRDISRQHRAEQHSKQLDDAIKLAKKMDAMSFMAGGMAHDFNNLLTVICGNLDIISLQSQIDAQDASSKLIQQAQKAALMAVDLTRQISCFSHFGIVSRKQRNLHSTVREAVEKYSARCGGKYQLNLVGEDIPVSMDLVEIDTAIGNVLQNAQEASGLEKVHISVSHTTLTTPELCSGQYIPAGRYGRIDIEDFGPGMDTEELFRVFDPYYSTKERGVEKGMGLGLTIVYVTFRNHGGYAVVRSKKSVGTCVSLYLPVFISSEKHTEEPTVGTKKQSILLVEPDCQMRDIGSIMLSHLGFNVITVQNSLEARLEMQRAQSDKENKPEIVILDISGINKESPQDCCRILKKIDAEIKVIAMSGTILDPIMEKCQEYGFAGSLSKPYTIDGLRHVVNSLLNY